MLQSTGIQNNIAIKKMVFIEKFRLLHNLRKASGVWVCVRLGGYELFGRNNIYPPLEIYLICPRVHLILFLFIRDMLYGIRNFGFKNTSEDGPLLNPENFYKVEQYLVQQYLKLQRNPL